MIEGIEIRKAVKRTDHTALVALASMSKFTRAFSSIMFSSDEAYKKGWVRVGMYGSDIIGLSCVRHKVREPKTVLYFLIVHPTMRDHGVGALFLKDLEEQTPHNCIKMSVSKENPDAKKFYERHGYRVVGPALGGMGWELEKSW